MTLLPTEVCNASPTGCNTGNPVASKTRRITQKCNRNQERNERTACEMLDCLTICNSACITCIWCILFSSCFPRLIGCPREVDSSECCELKKPGRKPKISRLIQCHLSSSDPSIPRASRNLSSDERLHRNSKQRRVFQEAPFKERGLNERENFYYHEEPHL